MRHTKAKDVQEGGVSVIMPIYNAKPYLAEAITSVLSQNYSPLELICINDGSTDGSEIILQQLLSKNENITLITQDNQGQTSARLNGLKIAKYNLVAFIDADDQWDESYLSIYVNAINNNASDIVIGNCIWERNGKKIEKINGIESGVYSTHEELDYFYSKMLYYSGFYKFGVLPYLHSKLFRKDMIMEAFNGVDSRICDGEDTIIVMAYLCMARRITIIDEMLYHYIIRDSSITESKSDNYYENVARLYINIKERLSGFKYFDILLPQIDQYMRYLVWLKSPGAYPNALANMFPFKRIERNSRIVLYGAGAWGKSYYEQLRVSGYAIIVAWVDKEYLSISNLPLEIESPEIIITKEFDYLVIALKDKVIAESVKKQWEGKGVPSESIII